MSSLENKLFFEPSCDENHVLVFSCRASDPPSAGERTSSSVLTVIMLYYIFKEIID